MKNQTSNTKERISQLKENILNLKDGVLKTKLKSEIKSLVIKNSLGMIIITLSLIPLFLFIIVALQPYAMIVLGVSSTIAYVFTVVLSVLLNKYYLKFAIKYFTFKSELTLSDIEGQL